MAGTVSTNTKPKVIVVGGGLAGLMTTIKVAEAGIPVDLFSFVPVKRSHSVCAQGGINGAVEYQRGKGIRPTSISMTPCTAATSLPISRRSSTCATTLPVSFISWTVWGSCSTEREKACWTSGVSAAPTSPDGVRRRDYGPAAFVRS